LIADTRSRAVSRLYLWFGSIALLTAYGCGSPPLEPRNATPGAFAFTLETFNVEVGKEHDEATVAAVGAADADIVCLQEAGAGWPDALREAYTDQYPYQLYMPDPDKHPSGALAILSRYPITDLGVLAGAGGWHSHPAWRVQVDTPGAKLQLLLVHLRAMFNGGSNAVSSYLAVDDDHRNAISDFATNAGAPIALVVGDFNEETNGAAVSKLKDDGFRDVLPLFRPGQATWRHPSLGDQFTAAIDHILFDSTLEPLDARVLVTGHSDHLPVVAHFELAQDYH
jgi:endonuclease/exonuclease/phosphatase family metal-dependent hydrolase